MIISNRTLTQRIDNSGGLADITITLPTDDQSVGNCQMVVELGTCYTMGDTDQDGTPLVLFGNPVTEIPVFVGQFVSYVANGTQTKRTFRIPIGAIANFVADK